MWNLTDTPRIWGTRSNPQRVKFAWNARGADHFGDVIGYGGHLVLVTNIQSSDCSAVGDSRAILMVESYHILEV